jgi:hypothetical protein
MNPTKRFGLATDKIAYNTSTGALYYDVDGLGGAAAVQIATLGLVTNPRSIAAGAWRLRQTTEPAHDLDPFNFDWQRAG